MDIKGLVLAAGLSSRMQAFKPLLTVNGKTLIETTLDSLRNCGVTDVTVIVGHNAETLEHLLRPRAKTVFNPAYATGDMFESVKLGLRTMLGEDGVLVLPADMPLISPVTIGALLDTAANTQAQAVIPVFEGRHVHPPLLMEESFAPVLTHNGEDGLAGVLRKLSSALVEVNDPATEMDADTPEEYARLAAFAKANIGVTRRHCMRIWDNLKVAGHLRSHMLAVSRQGLALAGAAIERGIYLDLSLVESGCMLHDILKGRPEHDAAAAEVLRRAGYWAIADVIASHMHIDWIPGDPVDERCIVFLADKMVEGASPVDVRQRYESALRRSGGDTGVQSRIAREMNQALALLAATTGMAQ